MELDDILQIDIYKLKKEELIQLLGTYDIRCDEHTDKQRELRPLASKIKELVSESKRQPRIRDLLTKVLIDKQVLTQQETRDFPEVALLQVDLQKRERTYDIPEFDETVTGRRDSLERDSLNIYKDRTYEQIIYNKVSLATTNIEVKGDLHTNINTETQTLDRRHTMEKENLPLISAGSFCGLPSENPNDFIDKFQLARDSNGWRNETAIKLFPAHLTGTALNWFNHFKTKKQIIEWGDLKENFITAFTPIAQAQNLSLIMERRIQRQDEPALNYFLDVMTTCRRYDPNIPESQIINYILQGLKPNICKYISTLPNTTLSQLEDNLRSAESYELTNSRNEEKYYRELTRQNTSYNTNYRRDSRDRSREDIRQELKHLTNMVANLNMTQSKQEHISRRQTQGGKFYGANSPSRDRQHQSTYNSRGYKERQDSRTRSPGETKRYRDRSQSKFYNTNQERQYDSRPQHKVSFKNDTFTQSYPRNYCTYCKTSTHNTDRCWYKGKKQGNKYGTWNRNVNKPQTQHSYKRNCTICGRDNHDTQQCYYNTRNRVNTHQKNV